MVADQPVARVERGGDEVAPLLAEIRALRRVALSDRPRRIDDERGGGEPEPSRLVDPNSGERRTEDDEPRVDEQAGEDRRDRAGRVDRADRGEVRAPAEDQPAPRPASEWITVISGRRPDDQGERDEGDEQRQHREHAGSDRGPLEHLRPLVQLRALGCRPTHRLGLTTHAPIVALGPSSDLPFSILTQGRAEEGGLRTVLACRPHPKPFDPERPTT